MNGSGRGGVYQNRQQQIDIQNPPPPSIDPRNTFGHKRETYDDDQRAKKKPAVAYYTSNANFITTEEMMPIILVAVLILLFTSVLIYLSRSISTTECYDDKWTGTHEETLIFIDTVISIPIIVIIIPMSYFLSSWGSVRYFPPFVLTTWLFMETILFIFELIIYNHINPTCKDIGEQRATIAILVIQKVVIVVFTIYNTIKSLYKASTIQPDND